MIYDKLLNLLRNRHGNTQRWHVNQPKLMIIYSGGSYKLRNYHIYVYILHEWKIFCNICYLFSRAMFYIYIYIERYCPLPRTPDVIDLIICFEPCMCVRLFIASPSHIFNQLLLITLIVKYSPRMEQYCPHSQARSGNISPPSGNI